MVNDNNTSGRKIRERYKRKKTFDGRHGIVATSLPVAHDPAITNNMIFAKGFFSANRCSRSLASVKASLKVVNMIVIKPEC